MSRPALDGDIVVAVVKGDILDEDVARTFRVDAIVVDELCIVAQRAADDIFAFEQMDAPEWRIDDFHPFEGNVAAVVELQ